MEVTAVSFSTLLGYLEQIITKLVDPRKNSNANRYSLFGLEQIPTVEQIRNVQGWHRGTEFVSSWILCLMIQPRS